jgi:hypothetical protein
MAHRASARRARGFQSMTPDWHTCCSALCMPGLNVNDEDLKWLAEAMEKGSELLPAFNRSRLIALGLIEKQGEACTVTEQGRAKLGRVH